MFDFDDTVTEKGQYEPPLRLRNALVELSQKMPLGFCTGRQWESFERHGLAELLKGIDSERKKTFLENLFLFAENGAIGYEFDAEARKFGEFYRVEWPKELVDREYLQKTLSEAIKDYGQVYDNAHRVVVVMRTNLHDVVDRKVEDVYDLSEKIYEVCLKILRKISADFEEFVHVGNSGIGVIIGPKDGDKDEAIRRFGEYLGKKRNIKFDDGFRNILVAGDSPQPGGNDYYFLSGKYGTPFNVSDGDVYNGFLKPVLGAKGERLVHSKGSLYLVKKLLK